MNGRKIMMAAQTIEAIKVTVDRVLEEYAHIAFSDIGQAFDADGRLLPIHKMPPEVRRSLAGIEVVSYEEDNDGKGSIGKLHKIKILDKRAALADVAKHLGMFIERVDLKAEVQVSGRETLVKELDERRKRRLSAI